MSDLVPTAAEVEELAQKAIIAKDASTSAAYHYSRAWQERSRWLNDTARILVAAEAEERTAATVLQVAVRTTERARIAHAKATS